MVRPIKYGTVKFFKGNFSENYGFIKPDEGGKDVYFHLDRQCTYFNGEFIEEDNSKLKLPDKGDKVVYELRADAFKPRVNKWAFAVSAEQE